MRGLWRMHGAWCWKLCSYKHLLVFLVLVIIGCWPGGSCDERWVDKIVGVAL